MSWYGDDLVDNSVWVLNKLKLELAVLSAAATAAKQAAVSAAAAAEAAATHAAAAIAGAAAASATALAAETAAAATAAEAAAAAAAAVAATAAAAAEAAAVAAACAAAAVGGMLAGQGIGWVGDKAVEGGGWLWNKVFGPAPPAPVPVPAPPAPVPAPAPGSKRVGMRQDAQKATDQALAYLCGSIVKPSDGPAITMDELRAAYKNAPLARAAYEYMVSNVTTLMHLMQAASLAGAGDGLASEIARDIIPRDIVEQAYRTDQLLIALRARPDLFERTITLAEHDAFVFAARQSGRAALPPEEGPVLRIIAAQGSVMLADDAEDQIAAWVVSAGTGAGRTTIESIKTLRVVDTLRTQMAVLKRIQDLPWAAMLAGESALTGDAVDHVLGDLVLSGGTLRGPSRDIAVRPGTRVRDAATAAGVTDLDRVFATHTMEVNLAALRESLLRPRAVDDAAPSGTASIAVGELRPVGLAVVAAAPKTSAAAVALTSGHAQAFTAPTRAERMSEALAVLLEALDRAINGAADSASAPLASAIGALAASSDASGVINGRPEATTAADRSTTIGTMSAGLPGTIV